MELWNGLTISIDQSSIEPPILDCSYTAVFFLFFFLERHTQTILSTSFIFWRPTDELVHTSCFTIHPSQHACTPKISIGLLYILSVRRSITRYRQHHRRFSLPWPDRLCFLSSVALVSSSSFVDSSFFFRSMCMHMLVLDWIE